VAAIAVAVLLLGGIAVAAILILGGGKDKPKPVAAKPTATATAQAPAKPTALKVQVQSLDRLLKFSEQGRAAAVNGDIKAAIANRTKLLADLQALQKQATDAKLKAAVTSFTAAIRESLRQNKTCGEKCPASALNKVGKLKQQTVDEANPLLRRFGSRAYRSTQI